ncbi:hypothetical protein PR048_023705 [Dryococelus australis]|uniref:Uncharacterized protein n=1 Tax=Dryococelus australis TaxID=614101 RepID=A0ABQ9GUW5_9NEOP|nr:hypothetical protein PR048_023705 [Dryococelus australis]
MSGLSKMRLVFMNISRVRVRASGLLSCVRENGMLQATAPREEQLMPPRAVLHRAAVMFNCILFLCTALVTLASKVTVEGKERDLQEALNHLASRLEGLEHENSDLKR